MVTARRPLATQYFTDPGPDADEALSLTPESAFMMHTMAG